MTRRTALALLSLGGGLAACSDDPPPVASESDYRETVLGEATELAVKQVAEKLVAAKNRLE